MKLLAALALGAILQPSIAVRDIDGVTREPLKVAKGHAEALFFVTNDCPVSNYYSHEIRRICDDYAQRGVGCSLVYTDATLTDEQAKKHAQEYGHGSYPKIVDRTHALVKATGAAITPTAVMVKAMDRSHIAGASIIPSRRSAYSGALLPNTMCGMRWMR